MTGKVLKDSNNLSENFAKRTGKVLKDSNNLSENFAKRTGKVLKDSNNLSENFAKRNGKVLKDSNNLSENFAKNNFSMKILPIESLIFDSVNYQKHNFFIDTCYFKTKSHNRKKYNISFSFGNNFDYKIVTPNRSDNYFITKINTQTGFSNENLGWQMGLKLEKKLYKNFNFYTGLAFQNRVLNLEYLYRPTKASLYEYNFYSPQSINLTPIFEWKQPKQRYLYQILELEIGLSYSVSWNKFSLTTQSGISFQRTLTSKMVGENTQFDILIPTNQWNFAFNFPFAYQISSTKNIFVSPNFRYGFGTMDNQLLNIKTYQVGFMLGFQRKF
jgi:hypothetical protein